MPRNLLVSREFEIRDIKHALKAITTIRRAILLWAGRAKREDLSRKCFVSFKLEAEILKSDKKSE